MFRHSVSRFSSVAVQERALRLARARAALPFQLTPQQVEVERSNRAELLAAVYRPQFDQLHLGSPEYTQLAHSARVWIDYVTPFHRNIDKAARSASTRYAKQLEALRRPHAAVRSLASAITFTNRSLRLEGSTLTEGETELVYRAIGTSPDPAVTEIMRVVRPKSNPADPVERREIQEAINHFVCMRYLNSLLAAPDASHAMVDMHFVCGVHSRVLHKLDAPPFLRPGTLRTVPIQVGGFPTIFPYPAEVPAALTNVLAEAAKGPAPGMHPLPFGLAFFLKLAHVHPFFDGNGRTARLLADFATALSDVRGPPLVETSREEYSKAVCLAQHGDADAFFDLMIRA